jgi:putative Ca2+/H+ antiporter (TMEM165/GDT1 family)
MSWVDVLGYAASACVLATFCMKGMMPLRIVAICSNVLFAMFGALAHVYPVLLLHIVLLPVNVGRLIQFVAPARDLSGIILAPFIIACFEKMMEGRSRDSDAKP